MDKGGPLVVNGQLVGVVFGTWDKCKVNTAYPPIFSDPATVWDWLEDNGINGVVSLHFKCYLYSLITVSVLLSLYKI